MDSEILVRNIVTEIVKVCQNLGVVIEPKFCRYYVDLLRLDPIWGISDDILNIRADVQKFIAYIVSRLKKKNDPKILVLKIQHYFHNGFDDLEKFAKIHRQELMEKLTSLQLSILETYSCDHYDTEEKLFHKMVNYITLVTGMGNPMDPKVYREVEVALKSVASRLEILDYLQDRYYVRKEKIEAMTKVVAGIRLYNMDCQRGGHGIKDLPYLLLNAIEAVRARMITILEAAGERIHLIRKPLGICYIMKATKTSVELETQIPSYATETDLEDAKDYLLLYMQYARSVRECLGELDRIEDKSLEIYDDYKDTLNVLHEIIVPNMHIRASKVFPLFESLYASWNKFQDMIVILSALKNVFERQHNLVLSLKTENSLLTNFIESDAFTLYNSEFSFDNYEELADDVRVLKKRTYSEWDTQTFEFAGFCPWKFVHAKGLLTKGDAEFGIVEYRNRFYVFSSVVGLTSFVEKPEYYVLFVLDFARKNCELINFLDLTSQLEEFKNVKQIVEFEEKKVSVCQKAVCTDTHIVPSIIDKTYKWNIWDLKREALMLATLKNCKTVSTQTIKSYDKTSIDTQKYHPVQVSTQTNRQNYSNTPKRIRYIYGLRGRKDNFTSDLTYWHDKRFYPDLNKHI